MKGTLDATCNSNSGIALWVGNFAATTQKILDMTFLEC